MSAKFAVGQEVLVVSNYGRREPTTQTVVKVGRKLVYVTTAYGATESYRIDGGHENRDPSYSRIFAPEEWAAKVARDEAYARLDPQRIQWHSLTAAQLDGIGRIVAGVA